MAANAGLRQRIETYLSEHHSMTLATESGGRPWAAAVFYVHDKKMNLYFLSDDRTRHAVELEANGAVAVTVNEDPADWRQIKGVQLEGRAGKVTGPLEKAHALSLYLSKFPFVKSFITSPLKVLRSMVIAGKAFPVSVYRVTPSRVFYLDNERGFSEREELHLGGVDKGQNGKYNPKNVD